MDAPTYPAYDALPLSAVLPVLGACVHVVAPPAPPGGEEKRRSSVDGLTRPSGIRARGGIAATVGGPPPPPTPPVAERAGTSRNEETG